MGITPKLWLIKQQLHLAKGLLETRHLTIDEVADKAGFKSSLNLRHHFNKVLGISPSKYRSQFSFNVIFSDRYKYLSLVTLNDINKNINGIKVYRDKDNLIATCFVDIAYGVTAQTMINQINHLIEASERLQLSLFDETSQVVN